MRHALKWLCRSLVLFSAAPVPAWAGQGNADNCPELSSTTYLSHSDATSQGAASRCDLVELLKKQGVDLDNSSAGLIFSELSKPYLITYDVVGKIPLPKQIADHLLGRIPDTAQMVNKYQRTKYYAGFVDDRDRTHFLATNGRQMYALFTYIYRNIDHSVSDYFFHETGQARVLFWRMSGNTIIRLEFQAVGQDQTEYRSKIYAFTRSKFIHILMDSALFRHFAHSTFERVVRDIVIATEKHKEEHGRYPS